jgi:hypothetical protein
VLQRAPLLKEFMSDSSYKTPQYEICISIAIYVYGNEIIIEHRNMEIISMFVYV